MRCAKRTHVTTGSTVASPLRPCWVAIDLSKAAAADQAQADYNNKKLQPCPDGNTIACEWVGDQSFDPAGRLRDDRTGGDVDYLLSEGPGSRHGELSRD
jgi:hypothetical protein